MKKTKLFQILAILLCVSLLFVGCGGNTDESQPAGDQVLEYDLDSGEDYTLQVDLGGSTDCTVYIGDTRLDKTEYTVGEDSISISSYSLMFLELNQTYTVKVETASGTKEYQVKIISSSNVSMDEADVAFDYANPADVVKTADFGDQTVAEIRLGARNYADASLYTYDGEAKTLTLKKELLASLVGETDILVRLSGGKEFSFTVQSTMLAQADFEDAEETAMLTDNYNIFWGAHIETEDDGTGNTVGKVRPEYDHLFGFGDHYWGDIGTVAFEKGGTYKVEFDVKPAEDSTVKTLNLYLRKAFDSYDPRCGIDPSGEGDDVQKYYTLDFASGTCNGEGNFDDLTYTYDEATGFTHVTVIFKTSTAYDTIFNCNTGGNYFDGDRPGETGLSSDPTNAENKAAYENAKSIFWYFDNLTVTKQ